MAAVQVEIWQVAQEMRTIQEVKRRQDVLLLRDERGRLLRIDIGACEAAAILVRIAPEFATPFFPRRPWSHDLMHTVLERLGARLERVIIDDFREERFYATMHFLYRDEEVLIDARPSDAIALVLRMPAPVFVNAEIMEELSVLPEASDDEDGFDEGFA